MKKNILIGISAFMLGGLLFAGFTGALAAQSGSGQKGLAPLSQEQKSAVDLAITNGDYTAWKTAMGDANSELTSKINESNFAKFAEAQKLMNQAQVIYKDLGIDMRMGRGERGPKMTAEQKAAIDTAITNSDYTAWKTAVGDCPMSDGVTVDNFAKYAEAVKLMQAGKVDEAKAIFDQLGIKHGFGMMGGRGGPNRNANK